MSNTVDVLPAGLRKSTGAHYTPEVLAEFVAQRMLNAWQRSSTPNIIRILDPAAGDGCLLISLMRELSKHTHENTEVCGFDTDKTALNLAAARLAITSPTARIDLRPDDFLDVVMNHYSDRVRRSLFRQPPPDRFDLVIANPPYVRTQVMGSRQARRLARTFRLSGRVDLYHAFIEGMAKVLRPGGIAGIIVSNRFMTTKSGSDVRRTIRGQFNILHVWDLGDTRLFEAAVLPAVLLLEKKGDQPATQDAKFTSIYSTTDKSPGVRYENAITALTEEGLVETAGRQFYIVRQGRLEGTSDPGEVWRLATKGSNDWLSAVNAKTYCTFGDLGKVRVGVKTTADKVFIRSDWCDMPAAERPELLRPLTTHRVARRFKALRLDTPEQILYPHDVIQGKRIAIDIAAYPKAARYLERYRSVLEGRPYVSEAGRKWFEIWVPQDPNGWSDMKLVFRDIAAKPSFWMDFDGSVVNGDCYWLSCKNPERAGLLWLALAVGNSSFIEAFYDRRFNNKLYAGRRRFITQYVEKFPLPDPRSAVAERVVQVAKELYNLIPSPKAEEVEKTLDKLVWEAFDLPGENKSRLRVSRLPRVGMALRGAECDRVRFTLVDRG